jgi:hypothetical protein
VYYRLTLTPIKVEVASHVLWHWEFLDP